MLNNEPHVTMQAHEARLKMRAALDAILIGQHVLITRNGHEAAVMIPPELYAEMRQLINERSASTTPDHS